MKRLQPEPPRDQGVIFKCVVLAEEKSETKDTQLTLTYDKDKQQIPLNIVDLFHVLGLINYKNSCFFSVDQLMECVSSTNIKLTQVSVSQMRGYILYRKLNMSEF